MKKLRIFLLIVLAMLLIAAAPHIVSRQAGEPVSTEVLLAIAGMAVSFLASYIPGFNTWLAGLQKEYQQLVMLAILVIVSIVIVVASCTGLWAWIECTKAGVKDFVTAFVYAVIGNQAAFKLLPQTRAVRALRA